MKQLIILTLMMSSQIGFGQHDTPINGNLFRASGDAILRIQPDQIVLSLGVNTRGKELVPTKEQNYTIMNQAIAYCKSAGIPEKYIQTDYIRINPHFDYRKDLTIDYYGISQTISIVIEDLNKYEQILTELLNIGINQVNNIEFRTTKLKEYRYQVRKMAIEAAKEKAQFLTEQVGIELGKIINIEETVHNPVNSFSRSNYANISQNVAQNISNGTDSGALSVGLLSIKARVSLTYRIKE